jgi:hypothetical protein
MSRAYNAAAVAHALNVDPKWLDNLLTHNELAGVAKTRQGVARQISVDSVVTIFLARHLMTALGATAALSLDASHQAAQTGTFEIAAGVRITVDLSVVNESLGQLLLDAVQTAPPKARGRPRRRRHRVPDAKPETGQTDVSRSFPD